MSLADGGSRLAAWTGFAPQSGCRRSARLSTTSSPLTASTRSLRPRSPNVSCSTAPPMPSSVISTTRLAGGQPNADVDDRRVCMPLGVGDRLEHHEVSGGLDGLVEALAGSRIEVQLDRRRGAGGSEAGWQPPGRTCEAQAAECRGRARGGRRSPACRSAWRALQRCGGARRVGPDLVGARLRWAASATSCCCAPSWMLRSIRRRSSSATATIRVREARSRAVSRLCSSTSTAGPASPRRTNAR